MGRVLLLLGLGYAALYVGTQTHFWLVGFWLGALAAVLTGELIRFVERSDRELGNFLLSVRQGDFSTSYANPHPSAADGRLRDAYQGLMRTFQQLRSERESNQHYLQTIIEHVQVALLCYDESETVALMNTAARHLFGKPYLGHLSGLRTVDPRLLEVVQGLETGKRALVKVEMNGKLFNLSVQATSFRRLDKRYKLLSFQDIRYELEAREVEAWQKLIRVLTHEIMNSAIPIATLTAVVDGMLEDAGGNPRDPATLSHEDVSDLRNSLKTIRHRSRGLVDFVKAYQSLTQPVTPSFQRVPVGELFARIGRLLQPGLNQKGIRLDTRPGPESLSVVADPDLVEQVLINLIGNAADALTGVNNPVVVLSARPGENGRCLIGVRDNGCGIRPEAMEHVFVPFYTTKPHGSGIGLSVSRQLVSLHQGTLSVDSVPGEGTVFTITLP
ncbi:MAG: hypothetical protein H7Z75_07435 [Ferruginibacter sp.]|nr:hypothetical protein [Cytophagales bacterium]